MSEITKSGYFEHLKSFEMLDQVLDWKDIFSNRNKCTGGGIKVEKSHKSLESCKGVTESVNFCEEIL